MKVLEILKKQKVGFYLQLAGFVLAFIPLFYLFNVGSPMEELPEDYIPAQILLLITIFVQLGSIALTILGNSFAKYAKLASVVLFAFAFAFFLTGSCLSVIDKIYNIVMWGDSTQFPAIVAYGCMMFVGLVCDVVSCWFKD